MVQGKHLNVEMNFHANTQQAQQSIQQLQNTLSQISNMPIGANVDINKFKQASAAAQELQMHLKNAYNASTGNIDLSLLNKSLSTTNSNLATLGNSLLNAEDTGKQAFIQLAQSISQADAPLLKTNSLLTSMWTTLKNTARWSISQSVLRGFTGAISTAYNYAKDLNESLTNIRIVTGQSTEQMAEFAEQANKAAKSLSTTTTAYTDAALIYYQQGLNDQEVKARTDVTMKMANTQGKSAEEVSDQLTSIWNNFAKGSENLEYYADAIQKLGATTASSSDEIIQGVQKFASVTDTIGLSFEYATAALATITATTRESAEVAGTALKTLFSRMEGLKQDGVLDDGTDLNKYSTALANVGVNIKDTSGQLKDMDTILDETANKWENLSNAQKMALAQTVAGVRQYTQFITLMNNWDFFQENVATAKGASGYLNEQQEIYEESWKAAAKQVKASLEGIYQDLLDDKFFINFNKGLATTISGIDNFIEKFGGLGSIITTVSSLLLMNLSNKIPGALDNLHYNFTLTFKGAAAATAIVNQQFEQMITDAKNYTINGAKVWDSLSKSQQTEIQNALELQSVKAKYMKVEKDLSTSEKINAEQKIAMLEKEQQYVVNLTKEYENLENKINEYNLSKNNLVDSRVNIIDKAINDQLMESYKSTRKPHYLDQSETFSNDMTAVINANASSIEYLTKQYKEWYTTQQNIKLNGKDVFKDQIIGLEELNKRLIATGKGVTNDTGLDYNVLKADIKAYISLLSKAGIEVGDFDEKLQALNKAKSGIEIKKALEDIIQGLKDCKINAEDLGKILPKVANPKEFEKYKNLLDELKQKYGDLNKAQDTLNNNTKNISFAHIATGLESITKFAGAFGSLMMGLNSFKSAYETLKNPDSSGWEKFSSTIIGLSMGLSMVSSGFSALQKVQIKNTAVNATNAASYVFLSKAQRAKIEGDVKEAVSQHLSTAAKKKGNAVLTKKNALKLVENILDKQGIATTAAATLAEELKGKTIAQATVILTKYIITQKLANATMGPWVLAIMAAVYAMIIIIGTIERFSNKNKTLTEIIKEDTEALNNLTTATDNAKNALQELKTELESYNTELDAFKKLSKDADDYTEKLLAVNEAAQKIIDTNNLIYGQDYTIDNEGLININENVQDKILKNKTEEYSKALFAQTEQKNQLLQDQQEKQLKDFADEYNKGDAYKYTSRDKLGHTYTSTRYGFNPTDDDDFVKYTKQLADSAKEAKGGINAFFDGLNEDNAALEIFGKSSKDLDESQQQYIKNVLYNKDKFKEHTQDIIDNSAALESNTALLMTQYIGENFTDSPFRKYLIDKGIKASSKDRKKDLRDQYNNNIKNFDDLKKDEYSDALEKAGYNLTTNQEGKEVWADSEGVEITNLAQAISILIAQEIEQQIHEQATTYNDTLNDYNNSLSPEEQEIFQMLVTGGDASQFSESAYNLFTGENGEKIIAAMVDAISELGYTDTGLNPTEFNKNAKSERKYAIENKDEILENRKALEKQQGIEAATNAGFDAEVYEQYLEMLRETNKALGKTEKQLNEIALAEMKAARGAEEFGKNWESWNEIMSEGTLLQQAEVLQEIIPAFEDLFNLSDEDFQLLPDNFIQDNWPQIEKALNGSEKAFKDIIKRIRKNLTAETDALGEEMIDSFVSQMEEGIAQGVESLEANVEAIRTFHDELAALNDLDIETQIKITGTEEFINRCNDMIAAAGLTATEIQDYFKSMGYNVTLKEATKPKETKTETIEWAPLDVEATELAGTPQFKEKEPIELQHIIPEQKAYAIESITPDGSYGGDIKNIEKTFNSNKKDSGGGGGSSKNKEENKKDPKKATDEIERYHMVTRALERLTRALEKVSKAKDRAFGKERLRLIDEEIKATDRLIDKQKTYLYQIEGHLKEDQAAIAGYGFTFDEYGEITNYIDVYQAQIAKFNSQLTDEAEEAYNEFKEATAQYEETLTLLDEQQMQLQDYINSLVDLRLEKITTEVEVKIRVNDEELKQLEYYLKKIEHYQKSVTEKIDILGQKMEQVMAKAKPIQEGIDKIYMEARQYGYGLTEAETNEIQSMVKAAEAAGRELTQVEKDRINAIYAIADAEDRMLNQEQEDQIQEYKEQLLELNEEMWEIQETIDDALLDTIDKLNDKIQENISRFGQYENMFNHLKNTLELTGKANTKEGLNALNRLAASTLANATEALKANVDNYEAFKDIQSQVREKLLEAQQANDEDMIKYWSEQLDEVTKKVEESNSNMLESFNDALEAAGDLFDTKVNSMIENLKKNLGDLDTITDMYNRAKELEELYLTGNQSIYELSKLARSIGKDIDMTTNLVAKNKLKELLEDINKLRANGVKLSQYDLEYWQAKYEVEKAEIALQEAQNAKSSISLVRNNEGAWGYVYTANSEEIDNALQNYEDKMYALKEANRTYVEQYSEAILSNRQEMLDALTQIDKTREDYDKEVNRIREQYLAKEQIYVEELTKAYERSGITYKETILGMISDDDSLLESHQNFTDSTIEMIEEQLIPAHEEWLENINEVCEEAGTTLEDLTNTTLEKIDEVEEASQELTDDIVAQHKEMRDEIAETIQAIEDFKNEYNEKVLEMEAINESYYDKTLLDFTNTMDAIVAATKAALDAITNAASEAVNNTKNNVIEEENPDTGAPPPDPEELERLEELEREKEKVEQRKQEIKERYDYMKEKQVEKLATGGYTGAFGPEGKLAVLHEKELVLNKTDTANILSAVDVIRNLTDRLNIQTLWSKLAKPLNQIAIAATPNHDLDQNVTIEASFPSVVDHNEIELALNNLVNTASQYASRY